MRPKVAAIGLITPHILIDGFVANGPPHQPESTQMPHNLLRRPLHAQQFADQQEIGLLILSIAPGATTSGSGSALGFGWPIAAIDNVAAVPIQLSV